MKPKDRQAMKRSFEEDYRAKHGLGPKKLDEILPREHQLEIDKIWGHKRNVRGQIIGTSVYGVPWAVGPPIWD